MPSSAADPGAGRKPRLLQKTSRSCVRSSLLLAAALGAFALLPPALAQEEASPEGAEACIGDGAVLDLIREERRLLDERREKLDQEEALLDIAKARIESDMEQLFALKREVEALLDLAEEKHEQDVDRLVGLYGEMRPKEAAAIIGLMDLASAVAIFAGMPERQAGPILAKVEPEKAQAISRVILDRNRLPADRKLPDLR